MEKNEKDLEEAAKKHVDSEYPNYGLNSLIYPIFIAGANWQKQQSAWIKCSERMPELGQAVLVFTDYTWQPQMVAKLDKVFKTEFIASALCITEHVIAWQPLPAPPTDL